MKRQHSEASTADATAADDDVKASECCAVGLRGIPAGVPWGAPATGCCSVAIELGYRQTPGCCDVVESARTAPAIQVHLWQHSLLPRSMTGVSHYY